MGLPLAYTVLKACLAALASVPLCADIEVRSTLYLPLLHPSHCPNVVIFAIAS